MIDTIGIVESNEELAPRYRLLVLRLSEDIRALPGQFAMLKPRNSSEPLLRRALAVYRVEGPRRLSFLYQVLGRGTQALSRVDAGEEVDALLPLGNSWPIFSDDQSRIVVAGGIGSASVYMLCEELARSGSPFELLFGSANSSVATGCGLEDFRSLGIPMTLTTDDGSLGERGLVTAPLEGALREVRGGRPTIYACGPWPMMSRVAEIASAFNARCLVSLEAPMGCGFGVCVGCVVAVKTNEPRGYGSYKRVCTDGSIFPSEDIDWTVNAMGH